jgi:ABC-2 type transport system permease protein
MLRNLLGAPIRVSAFVGKEIYEILREPRLVLTLILGPFLILLLFGIGFRNQSRQFRTLFVAPEGDPLSRQIQAFGTSLDSQIQFVGVTPDEAAAKEKLRRNEVDLVIVLPVNALESIRNNQQAVFTLYHNELDPLQVGYIQYLGGVYAEEINRHLLQRITAYGQSEATTHQDDLGAARANATALRVALEQGDSAAARQHQQDLDSNVAGLELGVGAGMSILSGIDQTSGQGQGAAPEAILAQLSDVRQNTNALSQIEDNHGDYTAEAQTASKIETELTTLETLLGEFKRIEPGILVSPFRSETHTVASLEPRVVDFYAPGVLALLLQHLAITFGALSIVRERQFGTLELFRVSPISTTEMLIGKYISYLLFGAILATILTGLLRGGLGVPLLGDWLNYGAVILGLLFTSLGIGFVISLISRTDSQAVQYAMIVLLASVFFSGFITALRSLWEPVRVISWLLPVTYGIQLFQGVMLRGSSPEPRLLGSLVLIGLVLFVLAWLLLHRLMARR